MNADQQFEQLRKLLALKRHEQPPPGYFDRLPRQIIARIESQELQPQSWLARFFTSLQSKPAFAGAFGVAACALVLGGIFLANQPANIASTANSPIEANSAEALAVTTDPGFQPLSVEQLVDANASSTNPVVSVPGIDRFFDGSLISSGAQPVRVQIKR